LKNFILLLMLTSIWSISFGQKKTEAENLVKEGIAAHDKGDYNGAISKYDKALKLDKDNLWALTEKGVTLVALQHYEEAINYCQKAIATHPGNEALKTVYVTYGNAADGLKKTDMAIEIYDEGITRFPDFYQLYYNKGISLASAGSIDEAMLCFQNAIMLNPDHAGSHNAIARISNFTNNRIPALLAYWRFLVLEPDGSRAHENLESMQKLMNANVEQNSKDSVSVHYNSEMFGDTTNNGSQAENNFVQTDLILSMDVARDFLPEFKKNTDVEKFIRKLTTVCESLNENKKTGFGFSWDYYVPYFIEMKEKHFIETYAYIAFISSNDPKVIKWLNAHNSEMENFLKWSTSFDWKSK